MKNNHDSEGFFSERTDFINLNPTDLLIKKKKDRRNTQLIRKEREDTCTTLLAPG